VEVKESVDEKQEEAKTEAKSESKVSCPDCGKQMSAKTLKYSHVPNCTATKGTSGKKQADDPIRDASNEAIRMGHRNVSDEIAEETIHDRLYKQRSERSMRRELMVNKLMQHAF
jgi:ssDNA-binding Zn-finger/Zn-ribbon topoisomerase 1